MSLDCLVLDIKYHRGSDKFEVEGDINQEEQKDIVETFLSTQIGRGIDESKPNEKDTYRIRLEWYPEDDTIKVSSDTGNKGLRDGILMHYLESLGNN